MSAMRVEAFVIHLARATQRRTTVEKLLADCPVPARVVDAVDGSAMDNAELDTVYSRAALFQPRYPFVLRTGEIGCFLSHRKAWQAIIDCDADAGLILEDDVEIDPHLFDRALDAATQSLTPMSYIQFQVRPVSGGTVVASDESGTRIIMLDVVALRTSAQLVGKEAARKLLALTERIDRPVDTFLQLVWETGVRVLCAVPSGVRDLTATSGGSTIGRSRTFRQRLEAEGKRFIYRRKVARLSRRRAGIQ